MVCRPAHSRTSGRALDDIPSHGSGRRDYADKIVCVERGTLYSRVQARSRRRYGEADGDGSPTGARQGIMPRSCGASIRSTSCLPDRLWLFAFQDRLIGGVINRCDRSHGDIWPVVERCLMGIIDFRDIDP
jgi:hypothetical protein